MHFRLQRLIAPHPAQDFGHVPLNMPEKELQARTQVVQADFSIRRAEQPIFGALAPAKTQVMALAAISRQAFPFGETELLLLFGIGHLAPMRFVDIADPIFRIDIMIAGKDITVVLNRQTLAAEFGGHAAL